LRVGRRDLVLPVLLGPKRDDEDAGIEGPAAGDVDPARDEPARKELVALELEAPIHAMARSSPGGGHGRIVCRPPGAAPAIRPDIGAQDASTRSGCRDERDPPTLPTNSVEIRRRLRSSFGRAIGRMTDAPAVRCRDR
jgi:hypothetical protein